LLYLIFKIYIVELFRSLYLFYSELVSVFGQVRIKKDVASIRASRVHIKKLVQLKINLHFSNSTNSSLDILIFSLLLGIVNLVTTFIFLYFRYPTASSSDSEASASSSTSTKSSVPLSRRAEQFQLFS
jgi:hypothetical protein